MARAAAPEPPRRTSVDLLDDIERIGAPVALGLVVIVVLVSAVDRHRRKKADAETPPPEEPAQRGHED